ncbi:MAG: PKD domain-containing protein [Caldisericia bacterium]|nr:PKD domain-containing protein [Caldisericia bacterium]
MKNKLTFIIILICFILTPLIFRFVTKTKGETPQEKLIYDIPEPEIIKVEDYDNILIKGCHYTSETGKPYIPYLIYEQNYSKNYKIQNVKLINKTNLQTFLGLSIPDVYPYSPNENPPQMLPQEDIGWYPKIDYDWKVIENIDGSTILLISVFPFIYNRDIKELKFYKRFEFQVDYIYSPVKINYLYLEKTTYDIEDKVNLEVEVENVDKESKDFLISSVIKSDDEQIIDNLEIQEINNLKGKGKLNLIWNNTKKLSGRFLFEVSIKDLEGTLYDSTSIEFSVGLPLIEIVKFNVDKTYFRPGDKLNIDLEFVNKGAEKVDGNIIIKILGKEEIKEFSKSFENLEKGNSFLFKETWNTTETKIGEKYFINAIIYYYGTTSQNQLIVTTNKPPIANFTYSPSTIYLEDTVKFDASSSTDPENNIVSYEWDFGDGYISDNEKIVTHKYERIGFYDVKLIVKDSAGEESTKIYRIEVKEKKIEKPLIIIRLYIGKTTYYVNDEIKNMDVAPIILEGRTLLPIRYVAEALGATVGWDGVEKKVTISFKDKIIELWIGNNTARVNGEYKYIDPSNPNVKPLIISGRTMLPIRFIAENLGCKVDWNAELKEVKITYPGS